MKNILVKTLDSITTILERNSKSIKALTDIVSKDYTLIRELTVRIENLEKEIETLRKSQKEKEQEERKWKTFRMK